MKTFWQIDEKGKCRISTTQLYQQLRQDGIGIVNLNDTWFMVHENDRVLEKVEDTDVAQHIKTLIRKLTEGSPDQLLVEEAFRKSIGSILSEKQLKLLDKLEIDFKRDDKERSFLFYIDAWVEVGAETIQHHPYTQLNGHIWKEQIIDRQAPRQELFTALEPRKGVFQQFLWNVCSQDEKRFESMQTIIGYLLHQFKDPSINKAIVFMDEKISEDPEGGTGKGIVMNALGHLRKSVVQDGKNFSFGSTFAFQDVDHSTSILVFDDVKRSFDIERLFSVLTDGLNVERKGKDRFRISKQDAPKVLINTNYVLKGRGNSHERRKFEFEFSQHYNGNKSPFDEFGHNFFDEWDAEEWALFDAFMMTCISLFLRKGLVESGGINIQRKKLHAETSKEFVEFMKKKNCLPNKRINRNKLIEEFNRSYPELTGERWYTDRKFCKWVRVYGEHFDWDYKESRSDNDTYFEYVEDVDYNPIQNIRKLVSV